MSFYKEVPSRQTTLESTLKFDIEPKAGSTNPVTSGGVAGAMSIAATNIAPAYAKTTYPANSYVVHDGILYTNPNVIANAENWNPAHWVQTTVANMVAYVPNKTALIGGIEYRTVQIGEQIWLAENLDYKFEGLNIGSEGTPTTASAWYYDNNEEMYGIDGTRKCGLLYNWYAVKLLNDNKATLCPGWHVPTNDELTALINTVGGLSTSGAKLKAVNGATGDDWPSNWNGTDDYGFAALPTGFRNLESFANVGANAYLWSSTEYSSTYAYRRYLDRTAAVGADYSPKSLAHSIRLVKD